MNNKHDNPTETKIAEKKDSGLGEHEAAVIKKAEWKQLVHDAKNTAKLVCFWNYHGIPNSSL